MCPGAGAHKTTAAWARRQSPRSGALPLRVGPQGLGGDATALAGHIELAATHITMNPIAVHMPCHSAQRARAKARPTKA